MACCVVIAGLFGAILALKAKYMGRDLNKNVQALEWRLMRNNKND